MPIRTFADQTTHDIHHGINSKAARRIPQRVWEAARRKMAFLNTATSTQDLTLPGLHLKPLKHDRPGFYSMRVNDQFRVLFMFENGDAYHVSIEDFHGRQT